MRRFAILTLTLALGPGFALADPAADAVAVALDDHILPGFAAFDQAAGALARAAARDCDPASPDLTAAWAEAWDAWLGISHLRFGPTETGDRGFALAFWPDPRGFTPESLRAMILGQDPALQDPAAFATASIAARGFTAMEFMLYDAEFLSLGDAATRCALIRAQAADIGAIAGALSADWAGGHAALMRGAGGNPTYATPTEAAQVLFTALVTGLDFAIDQRLARPLGTFDAPRPTRAEAWRSARSQRNLILSLIALADLAQALAPDGSAAESELDRAFAATLALLAQLDDPAFQGVTDPQGRFRLESLSSNIGIIRRLANARLAPALGVTVGFNAGDGD